MRLVGTIFNFYLNASVHVALAVVCLAGVTLLLLNIPPNYPLLAFMGLSTVVCYNFMKYGVEAEKYLIVSMTYHKYIQIFSFLCFGGALFFLMYLDRKIWWAVGAMGLVSTIYAIPLLPKSGNLRSFGGMKVFIVAMVWSGYTVLLPVLDADLAFSWDIGVLLVQRFLLVLALILPFEIRDLKWDSKELGTLPQILGIQKTKRLGIFLMVFFFLLTFLKDHIGLEELIGRALIASILIGLFWSKLDMDRRYLASFWVEGIPIFWWGFFWAVRNGF